MSHVTSWALRIFSTFLINLKTKNVTNMKLHEKKLY